MPRRSPRNLLAAAALVGLVAVAGACSSDDAEAPPGSGSGPSTSATLPTTSAAPGTTAEVPATTTPLPPPSVVPEPSTVPGAPETASACALVRDAVPVSDLIPRDNGQWPEERQRVLVDAGRDAALFARAAAEPGAPSEQLQILADFSTFVADTVQGAGSATAARSAIDAYPRSGEVGASTAAVARWQSTSCG